MHYSAYGHTLESALHLRDLPSAIGPAHIRIDTTDQPAASGIPVGCVTGDDAPWLRLRRTAADAFILSFEGGGSFTLSPDGRAITVHIVASDERDDGDDRDLSDTMHHLLVDQVIPLCLAHRGRLVVHGSGLLVDDRGLAFVGPGGAGKSTLAAWFGRRGNLVIADDVLVMEPAPAAIFVQPAYPGIRIWPDVLDAMDIGAPLPFVDGYSEKRRLGAPEGLGFSSKPLSIERVYFVRPESTPDPVVAPIANRDAVIALLTHSFVLDPFDTRRLSTQLEQACRVVERVQVRTLSFPRELERLDDVSCEICRDLTA